MLQTTTAQNELFSLKNNPFTRPSIQTPRIIAQAVNAFLLPSMLAVAAINEVGQAYAQAIDASANLAKRNVDQLTWPFSQLNKQ